MPSLSITPGRKFETTTSAVFASRWTIVFASGFARSSVTLRLFALTAIHAGPRPRSDHSRETGVSRMPSPVRGSTLITSAPCIASCPVA